MRTIVAVFLLVCSFSPVFAVTEDELLKSMPRLIRLEHKLQVFGGTLLGFNGGEWGGSLVFLDDHDQSHTLIEDNIRGIFQNSDGIFVITGLAHLVTNNGAIYQVVELPEKRLRATRLIALTGAPTAVRQLEDGVVTFLVFTGVFDSNSKPVYKCYHFANQSVYENENCGRPPQ